MALSYTPEIVLAQPCRILYQRGRHRTPIVSFLQNRLQTAICVSGLGLLYVPACAMTCKKNGNVSLCR